jgi:transposase InsO family protein
MKYDWMQLMRGTYRLERMCSALEVSRSGYYKHVAACRRGGSARACRDAALLVAMRTIVEHHQYRYGSPRMTATLRQQGELCSLNRVARLMAAHGLGARRKKRYRITTRQDRTALASPNLLGQRFRITGINRVWLTDITYIDTGEGWLFLTAVLDLASRRIVGWSINTTLEQYGVLQALRQALGRRKPSTALMIHSDRGSHYTSHAVRHLLEEYHITQSMSGTGNCYDNAPMESFFGTLKDELVHQRRYATREEARQSLADYIELYYNAQRIHSALDYRTPIEWERQQTRNSNIRIGL